MRHFAFLVWTLVLALNLSAAAMGKDETCSRYAKVALPAESQAVVQPSEFPDCASYKSYAGIGRKTDYAAARECAWKERLAQQAGLQQNPKAPISWVIGGSTILADIYANGLGIPKNLPLAIRLACEVKDGFVGDALDELEARAANPEKPSKRFDLCDYGGSTFQMNFCSSYQSEVAAENRERKIRTLSASWTPEQRSLFKRVEAEEKRYVAAHEYELDQGGTIHVMRDIGSEEIMHRNFLLDLRQFESGETPKGTHAEAEKAELAMREQFEDNLAAAGSPKGPDQPAVAVTAEGIRKVQSAWETYRDAWMAFCASRYGSGSVAGFRAYFANERLTLLRAMRKEIYAN